MVLVSSIFFSELFYYAANVYFQEICCANHDRFSATNCQLIINIVKYFRYFSQLVISQNTTNSLQNLLNMVHGSLLDHIKLILNILK